MILNQNQIYQLLKDNSFPLKKEEILCRCIDGRYGKNTKSQKIDSKSPITKINNLPSITIPGGDIGQMALILAATHNFGFKINSKKLLEVYEEFLSGWQNFHYHSDDHHPINSLASGCGYYQLINSRPKKFYLEKNDLEFLQNHLKKINKKTHQEILFGQHDEGAILLVKGKVNIFPRYSFTTVVDDKEEVIESSVFVFNQTLFAIREKALAKILVEKKVIELFSGLDWEYLTFTLMEMAEIHLFETLTQLAPGLPIYKLIFDENLNFKIEEFDRISDISL